MFPQNSQQTIVKKKKKKKKTTPISELLTTGKFRLSDWFFTDKTFFIALQRNTARNQATRQKHNVMDNDPLLTYKWHGFDKIKCKNYFLDIQFTRKLFEEFFEGM